MQTFFLNFGGFGFPLFLNRSWLPGQPPEDGGGPSGSWWGVTGPPPDRDSELKRPGKPVTIKLSNGEEVTFSPEEIRGLLAVYSDTIVDFGGGDEAAGGGPAGKLVPLDPWYLHDGFVPYVPLDPWLLHDGFVPDRQEADKAAEKAEAERQGDPESAEAEAEAQQLAPNCRIFIFRNTQYGVQEKRRVMGAIRRRLQDSQSSP